MTTLTCPHCEATFEHTVFSDVLMPAVEQVFWAECPVCRLVFAFGQRLANATTSTPQEQSFGEGLMWLAGGIALFMFLNSLGGRKKRR